MTAQPLDCDVVTERLIGGERPANDPHLAQHVGSCLPCFRVASDLRGLPQLRRQLLESGSRATDPGADFWSAFPSQVTAAWEAAQATNPPTANPAATAHRRSLPWWQRMRAAWDQSELLLRAHAWLRRPLPAAFGGALAAAAIILVVMRTAGPETRTPGRAGELLRDGRAAETGLAGLLGDDASEAGSETGQTSALGGLPPAAGSLLPGGAMDESLKELDVDQLWALRAGLEQTLADDVRPRTSTSTSISGDAEEPAEPNPSALSDELDELNDAGLAMLSQNLEKI